MQELLGSLLMWVVSLSLYPDPASLPKISALSHAELVEKLCAGYECNALAYYDDESETIFYDDRLELDNSLTAQGFLVHELVHYLQDKAGKMDNKPLACEQYMALERESYLIQQQFLRHHQTMTYQIDMAIRMIGNMCKNVNQQ